MADHKSLFVLDASVLIKWAVREVPNLEEALALRKDFLNEKIDIIVPSHCFSEVGNLLGRKYRDIALSFFTFLSTAEILECGLHLNTANIAFELMKKYEDISFYDASYHALAIHEKGKFLTADEKYFRKTKDEGSIMLLKDYA